MALFGPGLAVAGLMTGRALDWLRPSEERRAQSIAMNCFKIGCLVDACVALIFVGTALKN